MLLRAIRFGERIVIHKLKQYLWNLIKEGNFCKKTPPWSFLLRISISTLKFLHKQQITKRISKPKLGTFSQLSLISKLKVMKEIKHPKMFIILSINRNRLILFVLDLLDNKSLLSLCLTLNLLIQTYFRMRVMVFQRVV